MILMLYELLHKTCVSFLQYIRHSRFVLVRIVPLQVSHIVVWPGLEVLPLGFLGLLLGYFLGFLGPGLSSMFPESIILCGDVDL